MDENVDEKWMTKMIKMWMKNKMKKLDETVDEPRGRPSMIVDERRE